jgi:hypothetical protein
MKMEITLIISAERSGVVSKISAKCGDLLAFDGVIMDFEWNRRLHAGTPPSQSRGPHYAQSPLIPSVETIVSLTGC